MIISLLCFSIIAYAYTDDCGKIGNLKSITMLCESKSGDMCAETEREIATSLINHTHISLVTRTNMKDIINEKKLSASGLTSDSYLQIRKITGASHLLKFSPRLEKDWVTTAKAKSGELYDLIIDLSLINLSTSEIEYTTTCDINSLRREVVWLDICKKR